MRHSEDKSQTFIVPRATAFAESRFLPFCSLLSFTVRCTHREGVAEGQCPTYPGVQGIGCQTPYHQAGRLSTTEETLGFRVFSNVLLFTIMAERYLINTYSKLEMSPVGNANSSYQSFEQHP